MTFHPSNSKWTGEPSNESGVQLERCEEFIQRRNTGCALEQKRFMHDALRPVLA